jgi:putative tricarboxylic transport membrane protein
VKFDDAVLGVAILLFGAAIVFFASDYHALRHINYGPGFFPTIIGAGFILCGALLIGRRVFGTSNSPLVELGEWSRQPRHVVSFILFPGSVVFYIVVSEDLGFFLTMIIVLSGQIAWLTRRPIRSLVIAIFVTVILQEFFQGFMNVPLPWGVLEPFSGALTWT